MTHLFNTLSRCMLFKGLENQELEEILKQLRFRTITQPKDSIIASEGDECPALGIVITGSVEAQRIYSSGKTITMTKMGPGSIFGEAIVFNSAHQYPATIFAVEKSEILFIKSDDIISLCAQHPLVLKNFVENLSNRILMLNKKIRILSFETLRQKISLYLLEEYKKQKGLTLKLAHSKKNLAEHLGVQRPSLSRELIKMRDEGLIKFNKDTVEILDLNTLEDLTY